MEPEMMRAALFVGAQIVTGILAYRQGRKDARLAILERQLMHTTRALPPASTPKPSSSRRSSTYCSKHEVWFSDHCPDCTLPSSKEES